MLTARPRVISTCALAIALAGCPRAHDESSVADDASPSASPSDAAEEVLTADAPAADAIERLVTLVLASPDLPPQYVCLGSFAQDGEGKPVGDPVLAGGPFGIPDGADATGKTLRSGFPYGAVVKLPLFGHDRMYFDGWLPIGFLVDDVDVHQTVRGGDSPSCRRAWASARDVPGRQVRLGSVGVGASFLAAVTGCREGSSGSGCASLATTLTELDIATAAPSDGEVPLTLQVANLTASPSLSRIDVLLQPAGEEEDGGSSSADDAARAEAPRPTPLASGLARGEASGALPVRVDGLDPALAALRITPHGAQPCSPAAGDACTIATLAIEPFRSRYAAPSGGATGAGWQGHQVLVVFGGARTGNAIVDDGLRLGMFRSTFGAAR